MIVERIRTGDTLELAKYGISISPKQGIRSSQCYRVRIEFDPYGYGLLGWQFNSTMITQ